MKENKKISKTRTGVITAGVLAVAGIGLTALALRKRRSSRLVLPTTHMKEPELAFDGQMRFSEDGKFV